MWPTKNDRDQRRWTRHESHGSHGSGRHRHHIHPSHHWPPSVAPFPLPVCRMPCDRWPLWTRSTLCSSAVCWPARQPRVRLQAVRSRSSRVRSSGLARTLSQPVHRNTARPNPSGLLWITVPGKLHKYQCKVSQVVRHPEPWRVQNRLCLSGVLRPAAPRPGRPCRVPCHGSQFSLPPAILPAHTASASHALVHPGPLHPGSLAHAQNTCPIPMYHVSFGAQPCLACARRTYFLHPHTQWSGRAIHLPTHDDTTQTLYRPGRIYGQDIKLQ